jgi:hypothetical protein
MNHFTSSTSRGHASAQPDAASRPITRRGFLGNLAAGTVALAVTAIPISKSTAAAPTMSGAEYIAFLGGAGRPEHSLLPTNDYDDARDRWVELASGPLVEAIDKGSLVVCPNCRFLSYASVPCQICEGIPHVDPEEVADQVEDYTRDGVPRLDMMLRDLTCFRMSRALDLYDGPDDAFYYYPMFLQSVRTMRASMKS